MENGITVSDAGSKEAIRWQPDAGALQVLRNTICKGFSDDEFKYCMEIVKATGLNPIKRECWFIKIGDKIQTMTGINGYFTIANACSAYDGMEEDVVVDEKTEVPLYAWCKVYRKDRSKPQTAKVYFKEYYDPTKPLWKHKPCTMLLKVAESVALRKAFPQELNGTYTEEEMPAVYGVHAPEILKQGKIETPLGSAEVVDVKFKEPVPVIEVPAPVVQAVNSPDWSSFPYRYRTPPKTSKEVFEKIKVLFKENGAKFRGKKNRDGTENPDGDNLWYCNKFIGDLSNCVEDNPLFKAKVEEKYETDMFGGDNIPF